eukprot:6415265-Prymnesium_polylepis.1
MEEGAKSTVHDLSPAMLARLRMLARDLHRSATWVQQAAVRGRRRSPRALGNAFAHMRAV